MATYTIESVEQTLLDNADFEENASVAKAKAFVSAAKRWLILSPESSSNQSSSMSWSKQIVVDLMRRAEAFVVANDTSNTGGRVRFLSVNSDFR